MAHICKLEGHALFIKRESPLSVSETATGEEVACRIVKGFASTRGVDRQGDDIDPTLFDVDSYMRNAQLFIDHKKWLREDGNEVSVGIVEQAKVAQAISGESPDELRIVAYPYVKGEYQVIDTVPRDDRGVVQEGEVGLWVVAKVMEKGVIDLIDEGRLNAFSWRGRMIYDHSVGADIIDMMEISVVFVPANAKSLFMIQKSFEGEAETVDVAILSQDGHITIVPGYPANVRAKDESWFVASPYLVTTKGGLGSEDVGHPFPVRHAYETFQEASSCARVLFAANGDYNSVAVLKHDGEFTEEGGAIYTLVRAYQVSEVNKAQWSTSYINSLPDGAFAYIEPGGNKDEEGKTQPRALRHFPIKNAEGKLDEAHVKNALARLSQSPFGPKAKAKVVAAAKQLGIKVGESKSDSVGLTDGEQYLLDGTVPEEMKGGEEDMSEPVTKEEVEALKGELSTMRDQFVELLATLKAKEESTEAPVEVTEEETVKQTEDEVVEEPATEAVEAEVKSEEVTTEPPAEEVVEAAIPSVDLKAVQDSVAEIKGLMDEFGIRMKQVEALPLPSKEILPEKEEMSKGLEGEERKVATDELLTTILTEPSRRRC